MTVVEYMLAIIAIVLGLAIGKVLDKFSTTIKGSNWTDFNWFLSVWCLYILATILGYFWGFWRLYSGVNEIPYFEFLLMPFTTVTLIYLMAVFLPISTEIKNVLEKSEYYLSEKNPFFLLFFILIIHLKATVGYLEIEMLMLESITTWLLCFGSLLGLYLKNIYHHKVLLGFFVLVYLTGEALGPAVS